MKNLNAAQLEEEKKNLFKLIDSYHHANIEIALAIVKGNRFLKDACKYRYNPLMRIFDSQMGTGFNMLYKIADGAYLNPKPGQLMNRIRLAIFKHYAALGELEAVAHLDLYEQAKVHFNYEACTDLDWMNTLLKKRNWLPETIQKIHLHRRLG